MSEPADTVVARGQWGTVRYAVRRNGSMPAREFVEQRNQHDQAKLLALFQLLATVGRIMNREKFRQVDGETFECKSFQMRVSCYRRGNEWILLHGFVKKQDHWRKGELDQARHVLADDASRAT